MGDETNAISVAVGDDTESIVFDLVNPPWARRRLLCRPGQTWIEAPDCALGSTQR